MCRSDRSPFDTLEATFRLLTVCPQPLALDGPDIGLAADSIGLGDLRAILFHPATSITVQRAVLQQLVERARRHRGAWLIGLAGMLLPGLRQPSCPLTQTRPRTTIGLDGVALAGLLGQLDAPDMPCDVLAESLLWTVLRPPPRSPQHGHPRSHMAAVPGRLP